MTRQPVSHNENRYTVETCPEQMARIWRDGRVVGEVVGVYRGWTAQPTIGAKHHDYGWRCPTRREAIWHVIDWLEDRNA